MRILKRFLKIVFILLLFSLFLPDLDNKSVGQTTARAKKAIEHQNARHLELELFYDHGAISVEKVTIRDGYLPSKIGRNKNGWYNIELRDSDGELLYSSPFFDPRICFYDDLDSTTMKLRGGFIFKDQVYFVLRIPILKEDQDMTIADPQGGLVWQTNLSDLSEKIIMQRPISLWESETIIYNGDPENRIDLVFLGDGYTVNDTGRFRTDVIRNINYLFSISPYSEYQSYFNVHMVKVISAESGADHPEANPPIYRNTALGAYYNCGGIARLICANDNAVYSAASSAIPYWDKILLLVNDQTYGGSGGNYAIAYNGYPYWGRQVLNHELAHSFGPLLDEYLYGSQSGSVSGCNCDTDSLTPKWQAWIDTGSPGVGAFRGCCWLNYFRPSNNECTMNGLQDRFCVVCREQLTKSTNWRTLSFDNYFPIGDPEIPRSTSLVFWIEKMVPSTHDLKVQWYVDNIPKEGGTGDSFIFVSNDTGSFEVKVAVMDSTNLVLSDPDDYLVDVLSWNIHVIPSSCGNYICGDVNGDGKIELSDVIYLAIYLLKGGPSPVPLEAGNIDCVGGINVADVIYLANYLLKGGPAPLVC